MRLEGILFVTFAAAAWANINVNKNNDDSPQDPIKFETPSALHRQKREDQPKESVYEVAPLDQIYGPKSNDEHEYKGSYTKDKSVYAVNPIEQSSPSTERPSMNVYFNPIQQNYRRNPPMHSQSKPMNVYAVNPPNNQEQSYPVSPQRPGNVYAVNPTSNQEHSYPTYPQKPGNVYAVNPPPQQQNVYGVQPLDRGPNPDVSHYEKPSNVYGKPSNVYGKPESGESVYSSKPAYESGESVYSSKPAYETNPHSVGSSYPVVPPGSVPENRPVDTRPTTTNQNQPNRHEQPFIPNLLSTANHHEEPAINDKLQVEIKRDDSIYGKGVLGPALEPKEDDKCEKSETTANGEGVCKGQLIFHDDFDVLNPNKWKNDIRIPSKPDYEFVTYIQSKNNSYVEDGVLVIAPSLLSQMRNEIVPYGNLKLENCNLVGDSGTCSKQANNYQILPPVLSARMRTKHGFSFQYGRVEIKAKMPKGDWVYPELWLEPKDSSYGRWYLSGRVVMALSRGNDIIAGPEKESMGTQLLNAGCLFRKDGKAGENYGKYLKKINHDGWHKDYHNYTVLWTPNSMEFFVDNETLGTCDAPNLKGRLSAPWRRGGTMAPFDKEFYITLGLGVAGISEFPDQITSGKQGLPKPWKNVGAKAVWNFYEDESTWFSTWDKDTSLRVDSVSVYAL